MKHCSPYCDRPCAPECAIDYVLREYGQALEVLGGAPWPDYWEPYAQIAARLTSEAAMTLTEAATTLGVDLATLDEEE